MKNYIYPCLLAAAASLASCVDDKGSYTLSPINEVEITLSNKDGYVAYLAGDPVHISADVTGTMAETNEPSRYAYHWYVKIITNLSSMASETIDLSEEREFDYVADGSLLPGSYTLYLEVTDLETGLKTIQRSSLAVLSQMSTGYLVLGESTDGTVKMDMITTMAEDTILLEDVFTDPNIRKPESLVFIGQTRYGEYQNLWLTAADQSYSLTNGSYFELLEDGVSVTKGGLGSAVVGGALFGGHVAHDANIRPERAVHVVGAGREVEQHVPGKHENRAQESQGEKYERQRHGASHPT